MASPSSSSAHPPSTSPPGSEEANPTTTSTTTTENQELDEYPSLCAIPRDVLSTMSVEEVSRVMVIGGVGGFTELRVWGATRAANLGRLDLLIYFIETDGVRVNSFVEGEEEWLAEHFKKDHNAWHLPLQAALMGGHQDCTTYLMTRLQKEEVNTQGRLGLTALMVAACQGNINATKALVEVFEADSEVVCYYRHNALCYAVREGRVDVIAFFLKYANSRGGVEYYKALLENPCPCSPNYPLLAIAILCNHLSVVKHIVETAGKECTLYTVMRIHGEELYAHHFVARVGILAILKWLFNQGVPVDLVAPTSGRTALHYACDRLVGSENSMDMVRYLVEEMHANIHIRDSDGKTAEDLARGRSNHHIVDYLRGDRPLIAQARARRAEKAREAAAAAPSEAEMLQAAAAAEEAARSLLEELEAEEKAAAASVNGNDKTKKKKNKKKKRRGQGGLAGGGGGGSGGDGGSGGGGGDIGDSKAEEKKGVRVDAAVAAMKEMSITDEPKSTTAATAPGKEEEEEEDNDEAAFHEFLLETAPDTLKCPISGELFRFPCIANDGWTYERVCLEEWIATRARKGLPLTSPKLGSVMEAGFTLSQSIKVQVREYVEAKTKEWKEMGGGGKKEKK